MRRTGLVTHERYFWHDPGPSAGSRRPDGVVLQVDEPADRPEAKRRLLGLLEATGYTDHLTRLAPRPATDAELERFHTAAYLARLRALDAAGGGDAGPAAPVGSGSASIAALAAGGALVATEAVLAGVVDNAYALLRPAGHHALADRGMGFCLLNNLVVAALHARAALGVRRIAIVDWDVHHGNGTQDAFYADSGVLTISIHQDGRFPATTGTLAERGAGDGVGTNLNVPLPPGSGDGAYRACIERVVVPAVERFRPDLILVASGYDASAFDPMANMMAHSGTFRFMADAMVDVAARVCRGRLVVAHEGGYSPFHVPFCGLAVIESLAGVPAGVADPYAGLADLPYQSLQAHQAAVVDAAAALVGDVPGPPAR
jgi:acetoin utilization deacetylase AcuC-like enzyme